VYECAVSQYAKHDGRPRYTNKNASSQQTEQYLSRYSFTTDIGPIELYLDLDYINGTSIKHAIDRNAASWTDVHRVAVSRPTPSSTVISLIISLISKATVVIGRSFDDRLRCTRNA